MKTLILFFLFLCTVSTTANAQITKGNWLVGGDVSFSYSKSKADSSTETFNLDASPNVGYFFFNKVAFGLRTDYILSRSKFESGTSKFDLLLISPFARYYFLKDEKPINLFIESSYRFDVLNDGNSRAFSLKGGTAIFLNRDVAFEISLQYLNSSIDNSFGGSNSILLGFGIQVHLEKEK